VISACRGEIISDKRGWFVVRNRAPSEAGIDSSERDTIEAQLFAKSEWKDLPPSQKGIPALKSFLANQLCERIQDAFPHMLDEIEERKRQAESELEALGGDRNTIGQMRDYLGVIATEINSTIVDAINGKYSGFSDDMKLRMHVRNANEIFQEVMKTDGHTFQFVAKEIVEFSPSDAEIYKYIRKIINEEKGTELPGTLNPEILPALFREQAKGWHSLARQHFNSIHDIAISGITLMVRNTCHDRHTSKLVERFIVQAGQKSKQSGHTRLQELVDDSLHGALQPTDRSFFEMKMQEARAFRFIAGLKRYANELGYDLDNDGVIQVKADHYESLFNEIHPSNQKILENEVHDLLFAYYDLELSKFIANVNTIVIERYLMDPEGPAKVFNPNYILGLSEEKLLELAAEDSETRVLKQEKQDLINELGEAKRIAKDAT
jgi:Dynamin central region